MPPICKCLDFCASRTAARRTGRVDVDSEGTAVDQGGLEGSKVLQLLR